MCFDCREIINSVRDLNEARRLLPSTAMKLILAAGIYLVMGAVLALGIVLAVKGTIWFLIISFLVFVVAFGKIGCLH